MSQAELPATDVTYITARMAQVVEDARACGFDVVDLSIGNPDLPPPEEALDALNAAVHAPGAHRYAPMESRGMPEFREAFAAWYRRRSSVSLDVETQVLAMLGAKEAAHLLCAALLVRGDSVVICEPAYGPYRSAAERCGARVHSLAGRAEMGFGAEPSQVPDDVLSRTRLVFLNFPNNPTGALATPGCFERWIDAARRHGFLLCNDFVYSEIYDDGPAPRSLLEIEGALDVAVELHSLSKTYNLCGWRLGVMLGQHDAIARVLALKRHVDAGPATVLQLAAARMLGQPLEAFLAAQRLTYSARRRLLSGGLQRAGYEVFPSRAGMFVWARTPGGQSAQAHLGDLIRRYGIACNPGTAYGSEYGSHVRFSLGVPEDRLDEAVRRLCAAL
ncbi:aminotransferase class I/II-fold pyridoxal phosphate-dependent enzyme [Parasulfuritortus cantonensis]|uniref:Aminotransferase n=1 Tax=Parasulfuritortus cantonensis TaxID=2528202 RepID=A0A4R1BDQ6_9PROT|nr:aminotransferase class I/II-fold pyridoxal phosphate-dependent enzyme [Parasulfuritortus cantonensis]TCJ15219.1 aminotransferase class I/II-fold pyridoxal phosphate-dependent enzyme [Parasulfuritortus cantonensis]